MPTFCVLDLETTGFNPFRNDRVIEVAAVVLGPDGSVQRTFASLVNPGRDLGASHVHGIYARDVLSAPSFAGIARALAETIAGSIALVGHNIRFDLAFLEAEYRRLGVPLPLLQTICTMAAAGGGSLQVCCCDYGVLAPEPAHDALRDAEATARLFLRLLEDDPGLLHSIEPAAPVRWPDVPFEPEPPATRAAVRADPARSKGSIQELMARLDSSAVAQATEESAIAYLNVLEMALEDRELSAEEVRSLAEVANRWGLGWKQVEGLHLGYLARLIQEARLDGVIELHERADIARIAGLLGIQESEYLGLLHGSSPLQVGRHSPSPEGFQALGACRGAQVCFTGESSIVVDGARLTRELAERLATEKGLRVATSVTKKLDLLVAADLDSMSGKAVKARRYSVPIICDVDFWKALGCSISRS
ncbi:MAG: hypothetical protein AMXMBFR36_31730 [Acidobacteriota bacterium]